MLAAFEFTDVVVVAIPGISLARNSKKWEVISGGVDQVEFLAHYFLSEETQRLANKEGRGGREGLKPTQCA